MRRKRRPPMRRPMRPRGGKPGPGMAAPRNRAHRELERAHLLMEKGDYANAAELFERLARTAYDKGRLRQAPRLFLQTGKAYILAGDSDRGSENLRQGLSILVSAQKWQILHNAGNRVVEELEQWGHNDLAAEYKTWLDETLPGGTQSYKEINQGIRGQRPQLPLTCPSCGGPIRPDDVEWLDATTAECPYCGGGLRE
jgi:hypothetical protein